jgi:TRAP-type C4-dicarboxylate transport system substrate-binding protein
MEQRKKLDRVACRVAVASLALFMSGSVGGDFGAFALAAEKSVIELRFAEDEPATSMYTKTRVMWAEEIEKRTNGRLKIKIYPGGTLANGRTTIHAVQKGLADGGQLVSVFNPGLTPLATVSQCPTGGTDLYAAYMAMQYMLNNYAPLQEEFAKFNQKALWSTATGTQRLISKKPVPEISQLKAMKIRATAHNADLVGKLGATPVFIPMGETYEGLQRGTVEGAMAGLAHMKPLRFFETAKNLMMFDGNGVSNCGFGTMSLQVWNSLPKDIQKVVQDVSNEYPALIAEKQMELEKTVLDEFKAEGVKVYYLTPDDKKVFMEAGESVAKAWTKEMDAKGLKASEILDLFLKKTAEYEAEVKTKGYPWVKK